MTIRPGTMFRSSIVHTFALLVLPWLFPMVASGQWHRVGVDYYGACVHGDTILLVGQFGEILRSTDGGARWTICESGVRGTLFDANFFDARTGVIIGASGVLLRTTDGGDSWTPVATGYDRLDGVDAVSEEVGYIVTQYGEVLRTEDAGETWDRIDSLAVEPQPSRVRFTTPSNGVVIAGRGALFHTSDGGVHWRKVFEDTSTVLRGIGFRDSVDGIVCGGYGLLLRTSDGGESWSRLEGLDSGIVPMAVALPGERGIVVTGSFGGGPTQHHTVARSEDDGATWTTLTFPINSTTLLQLGEMERVGEDGVIVTGSMGVILRSEDEGKGWITVANTMIDAIGFGQEPISGIAFASADTAVAPHNLVVAGAWLRTTDGGITWVYGRRPQTVVDFLMNPRFFNGTEGVMGYEHGNELLKTTNAGATWFPVGMTVDPKRFQAWSFGFADEQTGFMGADGRIYRTTDGGTTWQGTALDDANVVSNVHLLSPSIAFCTSSGSSGDPGDRVYRTDDGGETWRVILKRQAAMSDIHFVTPDTGFVAMRNTSGNGSFIMSTRDGGETWDSVALADGLITDVEFFSPTRGMAVGKNAVIYETEDGGRTWELERPWPYSESDRDITFLTTELSPDRQTVMIGGNGILLRRTYPQHLSDIIDPPPSTEQTEPYLSIVPNPFHGGTLTLHIRPAVEDEKVSISILDVLGRTVATPGIETRFGQGTVTATLQEHELSSGIYLVVVHSGNHVLQGAMVIR